MRSFSRYLLTFLVVALAAVACPAVSSAGLIASDSFNYSSLADATSAGTGTGFAGNWSYVDSGKPGCSVTVVPGLTFGSLVTSGSAVQLLNSSNKSDWENVSLNRALASGVEAGQTVWMSYLFQRNGDAGQLDSTETGVYVNHAGANEFHVLGKGYIWSSGVDRPTLSRSGGSGAPGASAMDIGQTYMLIAEFQGVGQDASWPASRMWVVSQSDFSALQGAPITEAALNAQIPAGFQISQDPIWGSTQSLSAGDLVTLYGSYSAMANGLPYATMDEIRYGTGADATTAGVVPVPEPTSLCLLTMGALALIRRHR